MGVKEALSWVKRKKWGAVSIETDSLTVVQSIRSKAVMLSYFGDLINECLARRATKCIFIFRKMVC